MDNVSAFLRYLESERNFSRHTLIAYNKDLADFRSYCSDTIAIPLTKVIYTNVRDYVVVLSKQGLTTRSINRYNRADSLHVEHLK